MYAHGRLGVRGIGDLPQKRLPKGKSCEYISVSSQEPIAFGWNEQCQKVEGYHSFLQPAFTGSWPNIVATTASPVLSCENEGCEPEVSENQIHGPQMSAVSVEGRKDHAKRPEAERNCCLFPIFSFLHSLINEGNNVQ